MGGMVTQGGYTRPVVDVLGGELDGVVVARGDDELE